MEFKSIFLLLFFILTFSCTRNMMHIQNVTIVDTYLEDVNANDGQIIRQWRTIIETRDRGRYILKGKYGKANDAIVMEYSTIFRNWHAPKPLD